MNNKPIIGVMPLWDGKKQSVWIHSGYIDGVIKAGGAPVLLPLTEEDEAFCRALEICDGILITGGQDVSPALYGESPKSGKADTCPLCDRLEAHAVKAALPLGGTVAAGASAHPARGARHPRRYH